MGSTRRSQGRLLLFTTEAAKRGGIERLWSAWLDFASFELSGIANFQYVLAKNTGSSFTSPASHATLFSRNRHRSARRLGL
jgi:hypothetical protein